MSTVPRFSNSMTRCQAEKWTIHKVYFIKSENASAKRKELKPKVENRITKLSKNKSTSPKPTDVSCYRVKISDQNSAMNLLMYTRTKAFGIPVHALNYEGWSRNASLMTKREFMFHENISISPSSISPSVSIHLI